MIKLSLDHVLAGCALVVTSLVVHKYVTASTPAPAGSAVVSISDQQWQDILKIGHSEGETGAIMTIASFLDYECPFCRHSELDVIGPFQAANPQDVRVVRLHFPIQGHAYAFSAANAVECSGKQGALPQYSAALFRNQRELSDAPYLRIAEEVKVKDLGAFSACVESSTDSAGIITAHQHLGESLGITGTPTVIVNAQMFPGGGPTRAQLDSMLVAFRSSE